MYKLLFILFFIGCTTTDSNITGSDFSLRSGQKAANSLFQEFFLSPIAHWQNFSFEGQCFRESQESYLNWQKLMRSFSFEYFDAMEVQRQYNRQIYEKTKNSLIEKVLLQDKHLILASVIDAIKAEKYSIQVPRYDRINLIWIDKIIADKNKRNINKFFQKDYFESGYPVLISFCYSSVFIENYLIKNMIGDFPGTTLGSDSFSIFDIEGKKHPYFSLNFTSLFTKDKKLFMYIPYGQTLPIGFKGNFKEIIYY